MNSKRYRAIGIVCVSADSLDELQTRCKSLMRFCPELGNMDVYDQNSTPCGKMYREIIYMPEVKAELPTEITL